MTTIRRIEKAAPGERLLQLAEAYGAEIAKVIARAARAARAMTFAISAP